MAFKKSTLEETVAPPCHEIKRVSNQNQLLPKWTQGASFMQSQSNPPFTDFVPIGDEENQYSAGINHSSEEQVGLS